MDPDKSTEMKSDNLAQCAVRWGLLAFAWVNVGLGLIGIVVPGMPTTVFLIIAVWAFSKCSVRFQRWLWEHQTFGPSIRAWHEHRVIPLKAKIMASAMMTASFIYVTFFVAESWVLPAVLAAVLIPSAAFILSQASTTPETTTLPETGETS
ncbi:MAG: YbaN family protein [Proteobacteria bacterium]|nr:YbaN family protein [Pseudomonadota bacterium]